MSLGDFLTDSGSSSRTNIERKPDRYADASIGFGGGSWADEVEETYGE